MSCHAQFNSTIKTPSLMIVLCPYSQGKMGMYVSLSENEKLKLKIKEIRDLTNFLSYQYLSDDRTRSTLNKDIFDLTQKVNFNVHNNCLSVKGGIDLIQKELDSLYDQKFKLQTGRMRIQIAAQIQEEEDFKNLIMANISFVGGGTQIASGVMICAESLGFGCAEGVALVSHGINNVYENGYYILFRTSTTGGVRKLYRELSRSFGGSDSNGDYLYAIADLGLSLKGVAHKEFVNGINKTSWYPEEESVRLWSAIKNDAIYGWQKMGKIALSLEALVDGTTIYSTYQQYKKNHDEKHN